MRHCYILNIIALGPIASAKKFCLSFSHYKSMETHDLWLGGSLNRKDLIGRIFKVNY